jgi:hypothetical protein
MLLKFSYRPAIRARDIEMQAEFLIVVRKLPGAV